MKVSKFLSFASIFTLFTILYVFQQAEIFRLGYTVDKKHEAFQLLLDNNALLRYNVQKNASLIHLSGQFSNGADFQMPKTYRLVRFTYPQSTVQSTAQTSKGENIFTRLFGVTRQAEAKTINRSQQR
jgi:hypothetical protein